MKKTDKKPLTARQFEALEKREAKKALKLANSLKNETVTPQIVEQAVILPVIEPTVKVTFAVTQLGKNPFTMITTLEAKQKDVNATGLSKKLAFAMADSLYTQVEDSLLFKANNGYYGSSFRPKSVFCVQITIDGKVNFMALNTKGNDAVRMLKAGKIISRSVLVQKFALLAGMAKANQTFADILSFEFALDKMIATESETVKQLEQALKEK